MAEDLLTAILRRANEAFNPVSAMRSRAQEAEEQSARRAGASAARDATRARRRLPQTNEGVRAALRRERNLPQEERLRRRGEVIENPNHDRGLAERASDHFSDGLREYSPAALLGRSLARVLPHTGDYQPNRDAVERRTPEQIRSERSQRVTRDARERRADIARREAADPADSFVDYATDFIAGAAGNALGDPTTIIAPGRNLFQRMISTAGIGGAVDAALQGAEIGEGVRDEYSPLQTAISAAAGPGMLALGRGIGNAGRRVGIPFPDRGGLTGDGRRPSEVIRENIARRIEERRLRREGVDPAQREANAEADRLIDEFDQVADVVRETPAAPRSISDLTPEEQVELGRNIEKSQEPLIYDEATGQWRDETPDERVIRHAKIDAQADSRLPANDLEARLDELDVDSPNLGSTPRVLSDEPELPLGTSREADAEALGKRWEELEDDYNRRFGHENMSDAELDAVYGMSEKESRMYQANHDRAWDELRRAEAAYWRAKGNEERAIQAELEIKFRTDDEQLRINASRGGNANDDWTEPKSFDDLAELGEYISRQNRSDPELPMDRQIDPEKQYRSEQEPPRAANDVDEPEVEASAGPERAGNVNLDRIEGNDDIDEVIRQTADNISQSGRQTHDETSQLADELGTSVETLLRQNPTLADAPAYATAIRNLMAASAARVVDIARRINQGDITEGLQDALIRAWVIHGAIQERAMQVAGQAGRLLDSYNIKVSGQGNYTQALRDIVGDEKTDRAGIERLVQLIINQADNPTGLNIAAREAHNPRFSDYAFSMWYNWRLLSSAWTHLKNIVSTGMNLFYDTNIDHLGAAVLGQRNRMSQTGSRVLLREVLARNFGIVAGMRAAFAKDVTMADGRVRSRTGAAWELGTPLDFIARHERPTVFEGRGKRQFLETASRSLAAMDEVFRNMAAMANFYGLAYRNAWEEGLSGQALRNRVRELIQEPTQDMLLNTAEYAKRMRFQDRMGEIAQGIDHWRNSRPDDHIGRRGVAHAIRTVIPFLRTPSSLYRTGIRRSPLGVFEGINSKDWRAGGARRDLATARVAMGSMILAYIAYEITNDGGLEITGKGPTDYRRRQEMEASGWRQNTINGVPYTGIDPATMVISTLATMIERSGEKSDEDYDTQAIHLLGALADSLADSTFTQNMFDIVQGMTRQGESVAANYVGNLVSPVPGFARDIQRMDDEFVRDARGDGSFSDRVAGRIQNEVPETLQGWLGLSPLPVRHDVYGRPVERPDTPFTRVPRSDDPAVQELQRLAEGRPRALVGPPGINIGPDRRRLSALEFQSYQALSGQFFMEDFREAVSDPAWQELTEEEKQEEVRLMLNQAREDARYELFPDDVDPVEEEDEDGEAPSVRTSVRTSSPPEEDMETFTAGVLTSGRRTEAGNAAVGGEEDSAHLSGEAMDFIPAQGQSMRELEAQARDFFGPDAYILNEGDHVHVRIRGLNAPYYGARGTQ